MDTILLASVLKPANDVRMYGKIAKSLSKIYPDAQLFCLGNTYIGTCTNKHIQCQAIYKATRISIIRLFVGWHLFWILLRKRPDMVVICCIELLWVGFLFKIFFPKTCFVYDVQENYHANVLYTQSYPKWSKPLLGRLVRLTEFFFTPNVDKFWLAEQCYAEELAFLKNRPQITLLNKYQHDLSSEGFEGLSKQKEQEGKDRLSILMMGTLGRSYGVIEALTFVKKLQLSLPLAFKIIGYCADTSLRGEIMRSNALPFVNIPYDLAHPLDHRTIIANLYLSDIVLLPYTPNQSYQKRIPSKIYECLALGKAMIIQNNPHWKTFLAQYPDSKAFFVDFKNPPTTALINWCLLQGDTTYKALDHSHTWASEEAKLRSFCLD